MKPQPLDLEGIDEKMIEELNKKQPHDLQTEIDIFKQAIKQRLKSACEFYLKYKDNPDLLMKEQPEYEKETKKFYSKGRKTKHRDIIGMWHLDEYNEWLFRLAFKGVME